MESFEPQPTEVECTHMLPRNKRDQIQAAEMLKQIRYLFNAQGVDSPPSFLTPVLPSPLFLFPEVKKKREKKGKVDAAHTSSC